MPSLEIRRILVPTDFSETSKKALLYAIELALCFRSELLLLHVMDTRIVTNVFHIHALSPERAREEMLASARSRIALLERMVEEAGVAVSIRFEEGIPPTIVKECAERGDVDLIVMGTHGESGLTHLLYGGTADGVVRGAPCPVLTVNP